MRAAIYNPYLDTLGGGERYTFSFVKLLLDLGYDVDISWGKGREIIGSAEKRFGINFSEANIVSDINKGKGYDLCFWVSDGSIPLLGARNNILHFQVPFKNVTGNTLLNKLKLYRINSIVCNSKFTKDVIDKEYGVNSKIIHPPVDTEYFLPTTKKNTIIYVGRFSKLVQSKRQDIVIKNFIKMYNSGIKNYKLILAGGAEVGVGNYLEELTNLAKGYHVEIITNPSLDKLKILLGHAKFFWSAAGYKVDVLNSPQKTEHFGITVVEAMSAGVVPLVYNAGGAGEIIDNSHDGYLWSKSSELISITKSLIKNPTLLENLAQGAIRKSKNFGYDKFTQGFKAII